MEEQRQAILDYHRQLIKTLHDKLEQVREEPSAARLRDLAGFIVYDDTACIVPAALMLSRFLYVESCNQCPPCKFGSGEITAHLENLESGKGSAFEMETALARTHVVARGNRCGLPVGERVMIQSVIARFEDEFRAHFHAPCPRPRKLVVPKIVGYDPERHQFTYDERQALKKPDWTYA